MVAAAAVSLVETEQLALLPDESDPDVLILRKELARLQAAVRAEQLTGDVACEILGKLADNLIRARKR